MTRHPIRIPMFSHPPLEADVIGQNGERERESERERKKKKRAHDSNNEKVLCVCHHQHSGCLFYVCVYFDGSFENMNSNYNKLFS